MADSSEKSKPILSRREAIRVGTAGFATGFLGFILGRGQQSPPTETPRHPAVATATPMAPSSPATTEPTKILPTETPIKKELAPKLVDGMETWGAEKPLSREEARSLIDQLNSKQTEVRPDTYYGSFFITKSVLAEFVKDNQGESYQSFLARHEQTLNKMLGRDDYPTKIKFRRLVILADDTSIGQQEFVADVKDSDGGWTFYTPYKPSASSYYDTQEKIDYGLLHEIGHSTLHLPDGYSVDFDNINSAAVQDLTKEWQSYHGSWRPDIGLDLMSAEKHSIKTHTQLQLNRRLPNDVHNRANQKEAAWAFPSEVPAVVNFDFGTGLAGSRVEIYRSYEVDPDKRESHFTRKKDLRSLGIIEISQNGKVSLEKDQLFPTTPEQMIEAESAVLLFKFGHGQGKKYFRWMDVRDFNIAYWLGKRDEVTMKINGATAADNPETFAWQIVYGEP